MKKKIKKYGTAVVLSFSPEEREVYDMKVGDFLEFEIKNIERNRGKEDQFSMKNERKKS